MPILLATKILAGVAVAGTVGSAAILTLSPVPIQSNAWLDNPADGAVLAVGAATLRAHTNLPNATSMRMVITADGKAVMTLTDTELERSATGDKAKPLVAFAQDWDAKQGHYEVELDVYAGSAVVARAEGEFTVGTVIVPDAASPIPSASPSQQPSVSASPTTTASPSASPSPTASDTDDPDPEPTSTKPPKTTPTPKPSPTPEPSVTPEPPAEPLAGKVTRSNESNSGWTNTFTITGFRPQSAQMYVEINLHNTISAPYYAGYQSYPCGTATLYAGSGSTATYQCSVTITIQPPGNWRDGEYWRAMPGSVFRSKAVVGSKTLTGTGGNWNVSQKPA